MATTAPKVAEAKIKNLRVEQPQFKTIEFTIRGETPLITHRFSERNMELIEQKQGGEGTNKKPPRVPEDEFEDAKYVMDDGRCAFPALAIKLAMIEAAYQCCGVPKTGAKAAFNVTADLIPIEPQDPDRAILEPTMRRDRVRLGGKGGVTSIAYRPAFAAWQARVPIRYNANMVTVDQLYSFLMNAGMSIGIGDWRSQCNGIYGSFEVDRTVEYAARPAA